MFNQGDLVTVKRKTEYSHLFDEDEVGIIYVDRLSPMGGHLVLFESRKDLHDGGGLTGIPRSNREDLWYIFPNHLKLKDCKAIKMLQYEEML